MLERLHCRFGDEECMFYPQCYYHKAVRVKASLALMFRTFASQIPIVRRFVASPVENMMSGMQDMAQALQDEDEMSNE